MKSRRAGLRPVSDTNIRCLSDADFALKSVTTEGLASEKAGITKHATPHTLRHSFATHLIEAGISLHHVQLLLGHRSPTTTTVYLHVSQMALSQVTSPIDKQL